jgi:hypothetical protein
MPNIKVKENEPFDTSPCVVSSAPVRKPAFSPRFASASTMRNPPLFASALPPPRSSVT